MNKIKSILFLVGISMFLLACTTKNNNDVSSLENGKVHIDKIVAQFNYQKVEISRRDDIEKLENLFNEDNYTRNPQKDGGKGWIYKLTVMETLLEKQFLY